MRGSRTSRPRLFHSPKRGVMPATSSILCPRNPLSFIPLNGALCLQQRLEKKRDDFISFIPLNGALCLQPVITPIRAATMGFIPLNGALCLQRSL